MTEREWDIFVKLLGKVFRLPGTWQQKRDAINREIDDRDDEIDMCVFGAWFDDTAE